MGIGGLWGASGLRGTGSRVAREARVALGFGALQGLWALEAWGLRGHFRA